MSKFRNVRLIALVGMLTAVAIVLGFFKIVLSPVLEIRFVHFALAAAGYLFGPAVGLLVGVLSDIGGYLVRPTGPFFGGFTLSAALSGVIYALFLHRKKISIYRCFAAEGLKTLLVGILLNTWWLSLLYKNPFTVVLFARLPKELVMFPVNSILLFLLLQALSRVPLDVN